MTGPAGPPPFVPGDLGVPGEGAAAEFRLEPLGPRHNAGDHDAWTPSMAHIRATPGFAGQAWPTEMPPEENVGDLRRHAEDFAARTGFTHTVLAGARDRVVACVYVYPAEDGAAGTADVRSWVRADRAGLDLPLHTAVSAWLAGAWPFTAARYAPRPAAGAAGPPAGGD
jgi:hypothetical protein